MSSFSHPFARSCAAASLALAALSLPAHGQITFAGHKIEVHTFLSQGFAKSNDNNYLTMNTGDGTGRMTDGGVNVSFRATDKLRFAVQAYSRNIGLLGRGKVELDFAMVDYRLRDWMGFRAGKVKTPLGLFNDTQDMEFLHTWALLPQSVYALDLRSTTIAHTGGDLYGTFGLKKAGNLSYQIYGGSRPDDLRGGYHYALEDLGLQYRNSLPGWTAGYDVRWSTPVSGLIVGNSLMKGHVSGNGLVSGTTLASSFSSNMENHIATYADYTYKKLRLNTEYRYRMVDVDVTTAGQTNASGIREKGWFGSVSYRLASKVEIGTYHSRYFYNDPTKPAAASSPADHIRDQVVTVRFEPKSFWTIKVEGHFMDGYGNPVSARGFYLRSNPQGLKPQTNMLVLRTGFNF